MTVPNQTNDYDACTEHFNRIYNETFNEVKVYVASKCADPSYIGDILQETYFELYKLLLKKGVGYLKDPHAIVFTIAKRRVFRYYSMKSKLAMIVPLFATNNDGEEYCIAEADVEPETNAVLSEMEAERIWGIISTYPSDVRKIMYLYFNCGMSHSQIAEQLGCSLSNVKNKLYRTLAEIREKEKNSYE